MRKLIVASSFLLIAASPPPTEAEIGPQPTFTDAVAMTEQAIRTRLIDPESARIEWPYGFAGGSLKAMLGKRRAGWFTCGLVNAKNRMGGYTGQSYFEVLIHNGVIEFLDIGEAGQDIDLVALSCEKMLKDGLLPPAPPLPIASSGVQSMPAMAAAGAANAAAQGGLGITFMPSPMGAILIAVAPGSRAERAGLKPGETIEAVNGASIKGLDQNTIVALIRAQTTALKLGVVGVGNVAIATDN